MNDSSYAGVDLGTSGIRVTVVDGDGSPLAEAEAEYPVKAPHPGWSESDPGDWLAAYHRCVERLATKLGRPPSAVGFAGQMHGIVPCDETGEALRPAVLWPDRRAEPLLDDWRDLDPQRLGNPVVAGMAGPILGWLHQHEPQVLTRTALVRSPKDWLRGRLCGDAFTEPSDASATLLWDVVESGWSPAARDLAGLRADQLPDVTGSTTVTGTIDWAGESVPAVAGGADTACVLDAVRAVPDVARGSLVVNLGTGIQLLRPTERPPESDPATHHYLDTAAETYEMLAVQNGGLALTWALSTLRCEWGEAIELASAERPGADGVSFLPFLTGERGHLAPPDARASWTGMSQHSGRSALVRSAFEAMAFCIRRARELLEDDSPVVLTGGGSRDPFVRRLIADVLGVPVDAVAMRSATAIGAAIVAARGVGAGLAPRAETVRVVPTGRPGLARSYDRWRRAIEGSHNRTT